MCPIIMAWVVAKPLLPAAAWELVEAWVWVAAWVWAGVWAWATGMQQGYGPNQGGAAPSADQELGKLKEEAKALKDQLGSILSRIEDLEKK